MFKNVKRISIEKITNDTVITMQRKLKSISPRTTKALMIDLNCFGPLSYSMSISNQIKEFKKEKKVPVYTFGENVVMGPALLILASGDKAFSDKFTMFGFNDLSVGKFNFHKFTKKRDVGVKFIASGRYKVRLNPFDEVRDDDEDWVKDILRKQKHIMVDSLREIRGSKFDEGKFLSLDDMFLGEKAFEAGLIDGFESVDSIVMKEFDNKRTKMVRNKIAMSDWMNMISFSPKMEMDWDINAEVVEHLVDNSLRNDLL
jgi:ClpP class serine protease